MEKRRFKRLPIRLGLSCHRVDSSEQAFHFGHTIDVSPGGMYFETVAGSFEPGSLVKIDLSIPPTDGLLEFGGRVSGFAMVLRTCCIAAQSADDAAEQDYHGVAVEFCQPLRLSM